MVAHVTRRRVSNKGVETEGSRPRGTDRGEETGGRDIGGETEGKRQRRTDIGKETGGKRLEKRERRLKIEVGET
jgi:hypothetical protein